MAVRHGAPKRMRLSRTEDQKTVNFPRNFFVLQDRQHHGNVCSNRSFVGNGGFKILSPSNGFAASQHRGRNPSRPSLIPAIHEQNQSPHRVVSLDQMITMKGRNRIIAQQRELIRISFKSWESLSLPRPSSGEVNRQLYPPQEIGPPVESEMERKRLGSTEGMPPSGHVEFQSVPTRCMGRRAPPGEKGFLPSLTIEIRPFEGGEFDGPQRLRCHFGAHREKGSPQTVFAGVPRVTNLTMVPSANGCLNSATWRLSLTVGRVWPTRDVEVNEICPEGTSFPLPVPQEGWMNSRAFSRLEFLPQSGKQTFRAKALELGIFFVATSGNSCPFSRLRRNGRKTVAP